MKTSVAKAKGRRLQQWIRDLLIVVFDASPDDIRSQTMGESGEDIPMCSAIRKQFPYSIEAKNQERVSIWEAYKQACSNCNEHEPLLIIKRNHHKPLAVVDAEYFIKLHKNIDQTTKFSPLPDNIKKLWADKLAEQFKLEQNGLGLTEEQREMWTKHKI